MFGLIHWRSASWLASHRHTAAGGALISTDLSTFPFIAVSYPLPTSNIFLYSKMSSGSRPNIASAAARPHRPSRIADMFELIGFSEGWSFSPPFPLRDRCELLAFPRFRGGRYGPGRREKL